MATINRWERQPNERPEAYEAFAIYRDLPGKRSAREVGERLGKSEGLIERWCSKWDWVERARLWDNEIAAKVKEAAEKTASEMVQRHLKISMQLQTKAVTALNQIAGDEMTARDIAALLKLGVDIERLNRGEPTERTENEVKGRVTIESDPYAELTVEELRKLARLPDGSEG
jgi:hypothetical protein